MTKTASQLIKELIDRMIVANNRDEKVYVYYNGEYIELTHIYNSYDLNREPKEMIIIKGE